MTLSQSVQESLNEASASLRNALAYAACQERPIVCNSIAKILCEIDSMESFDGILDHLEQLQQE